MSHTKKRYRSEEISPQSGWTVKKYLVIWGTLTRCPVAHINFPGIAPGSNTSSHQTAFCRNFIVFGPPNVSSENISLNKPLSLVSPTLSMDQVHCYLPDIVNHLFSPHCRDFLSLVVLYSHVLWPKYMKYKVPGMAQVQPEGLSTLICAETLSSQVLQALPMCTLDRVPQVH